MTEASYTAWDDNEYQWPPPEGWYQSSDGKWWPEGYGPPAAAPAEAVPESDSIQEGSGSAPEEAGPLAEFEPVAPFVPPANFEPPVDPEHPVYGSAVHPGSVTDGVAEGVQNGINDAAPVRPSLFNDPPTNRVSFGDQPIDRPAIEGTARDGRLFDSGRADSPPVGAAPVEELTAAEISALDAPAIDAPVIGSPAIDSPAAEAPLNESTVYTAPPTGPPTTNGEHTVEAEPAPETVATPSKPVGLDFGGAAGVSIPDSQEILGAAPKGSSRGLWLAVAGAIVLVAIGAGLYLALGGDEEPTETVTPVITGPGSLDEPHARASGVVVFYPDGDLDQRWIVEVLEPVRDATVELGGSDSLTLAATRLRIRNESGAELASVSDLRFNVVDGSGAVIVRTDNLCPAAADDLNFEASVPVGSTVDGTICWAVPGQAADLAGLKLGIESPKVQGRIHISLQ